MTETVLVTGATGFLGQHVLDALEDLLPDVRPVALVRDRLGFERSGRRPRVLAVEGRLEDADRWSGDAALARCRGILHLAALVRHSRRDAAPVFRTNVGGTQEMVRLAARLGCRIVALSTSGTVGCSVDRTAAPDEDAPFADRTVGDWPYYASKIAAERAARALAGVLDVELVTLRPPVLLGPGDHGGRASSIVRRMRRPRPLVVDGGYHFADVRDIARAVVRAWRHPRPRPVYHLPGWSGTLADLAQLVADAEGRRCRPRRIPQALAMRAARWLAPFGWFHDPVLVEMAAHHWGLRSRHSARELDYRSRDPLVTIRDTLHWRGAGAAVPLERVLAHEVGELPARAEV